MDYYFITGSSSGIGKALAGKILQDTQSQVTGIARRQTIEHARYHHITADLSDPEVMKRFAFQPLKNADSITLVNNAGTLGDLKPNGQMDNDAIVKSYLLNLAAPHVLSNIFMKAYKDFKGKKVILSTSSGAAHHTVPSWSSYCGSKAGLDMVSRVMHDEQKAQGGGFYIFSVAPGIIDTPMQNTIRSTSKEDFPGVDRFISLWENNELVSPEQVAASFLDIIKKPEKYPEVSMDLRKI